MHVQRLSHFGTIVPRQNVFTPGGSGVFKFETKLLRVACRGLDTADLDHNGVVSSSG